MRASRPFVSPESCTIAIRTPPSSSSSCSGAPQAATSQPSQLPITARSGAYAPSSASTSGEVASPGVQDLLGPLQVRHDPVRQRPREVGDVGVPDREDVHRGSVTAPSLADVTCAAYFANTPRV